MVNQVTVIGILMIVNGSLATLLGILIAIVGPLMFSLFTQQGAQMPQEAQQVVTVISVVYLVYGSVIAIAGIMNIAGGISALRFRSRNFVITALFFNIAALCSYCLPTSLGLMIWGLIVMFQGDVAQAFTLGMSGYSADEIKQRMGVGRVYRRNDPRWEDERDERPRRDQPDDDLPPESRGKPPPRADEGDERIIEK